MSALRATLTAALCLGLLGGCSVDNVDERFLSDAAGEQGVLLALGTIGSEAAMDDAVRAQAQGMAAISRTELDQLGAYARRESLEDPGRIGPAAARELDRLRELSGKEFDRAYLTAAINNNHVLIEVIEIEVAAGKDRELHHWAEEHLRTAKRGAMQLRRVAFANGFDLPIHGEAR